MSYNFYNKITNKLELKISDKTKNDAKDIRRGL